MKNIFGKNILLIDGVGALFSALAIGFILPYFEVGLSREILYSLSAIALVICFNSLTCFFRKQNNKEKLTLIAYTNLAYCLLTTLVVAYFYASIDKVGIAYFLSEIIVILVLVYIEFDLARKKV